MTKSARRRSAIGGGLVHDAGEFGRGGDRRRRSSARAEFEVSAELGRAAADISEVDRGGDRRRRSAARAERSGRARAAPRPSATWCRPCRARAAADTSAAVAELDQEHAGEVDRGGDRRRGAARPRAAPRPIGGDVVQTDRRTAATWCRPCRARAAPRPTSAQRSPSSSSTRGTPGSSAAAASVASWCTTSDLVRSRPISSGLVRSRRGLRLSRLRSSLDERTTGASVARARLLRVVSGGDQDEIQPRESPDRFRTDSEFERRSLHCCRASSKRRRAPRSPNV